jgi:drug/metabolite transporter (DMT)-like permease
VIAVLGGLGAAIAWGLAALSSARASRTIGSTETVAWVMIVGLVACVPLLVVDRPTSPPSSTALLALLVVGIGYACGLLLYFAALARGKIGIAAAITSTEGAIAATIAIVSGESATPLVLLALAVIAVGVVAATLAPGTRALDLVFVDRRFLTLAVSAALLFGVSLYAGGFASGSLPLSWVVTAGRVAGVLLVAAPLALRGRLRISRAALPFVVASGLLEVAGYVSFTFGSRDSISIAAMTASQSAAMATLFAAAVGERLGRRQAGGIAAVAVGVGLVALLRA